MKRTEITQTDFGEAELNIVQCDFCGSSGVDVKSWGIKLGWMRLTRPALDTAGNERTDSRREEDYCSIDCLVRSLVPDIYSTDPTVVKAAIANLQKIEESLGQRA